MFELQLLRTDHRPEVLRFETANREYFKEFITDRGDEYFDKFDSLFRGQLDELWAGTSLLFVLVDDDGHIAGRFNLYNVRDRSGDVGYRIARDMAGQGTTTAFVGELCQLAATVFGLQRLRATTSKENLASARVLTKNGFELVGGAEVRGRPGLLFEKALKVTASPSF